MKACMVLGGTCTVNSNMYMNPTETNNNPNDRDRTLDIYRE